MLFRLRQKFVLIYSFTVVSMGNKLGRRRASVDERYTRPQGLYQHRDIDHMKLRRLILDSKLAPCYAGAEDAAWNLEECPICFLHYPSLNRSKCCSKGVCTECFLQMKPPLSIRPTQCPYCKTSNYAVEYRGIKSNEEKCIEEIEEKRVMEAKTRIQQDDNDQKQLQNTQVSFQGSIISNSTYMCQQPQQILSRRQGEACFGGCCMPRTNVK